MISRKNENEEKVKLRTRFKKVIINSFIGSFIRNISIVLKSIYQYIDRRIKQSVQFELMIVVVLCFLASVCSYIFLNNILRKEETITKIIYDYKNLVSNAEGIALNIEESAKDNKININDKKYFQDIFNLHKNEGDKIFITNLDGEVLIKTDNVDSEKVDIFNLLKSITDTNYRNDLYSESISKEFVALYPISINDEQYYLIYKSIPKGKLEYEFVASKDSVLAVVISFLIFIILFLIVTNRKMKYIHNISEGLKIISDGDLEYVIPELGEDEISRISININIMAKEVNKQIEAQKIAEQTKNELITNVSHDLKTPLTSIMGYIGLVRECRYDSEEAMREYLDIASNKTEQLKVLIDDLFEYTKVNNCDMSFSKSEINFVDLISQISEEMKPYFEENNIEQVVTLPDSSIILSLDAAKMVRVIENLFTNAVKYSYKPGVVFIGLYEKNGFVTMSVKNKGDNISEENLDKLFDRFYRIDESRNTNSGGSGLGLAIAKTIVERHGGKIWAECYGNDISFNVRFRI